MHAISAFAPAMKRTVSSPLSPARVYSFTLAGLTLLGFGLRLYLIDSFPLREDEAIYSYWALHFGHEDPFFLTVWPDKPPLFLWLLSGVFQWFGTSQASARWLNIAISTLTIPVVGACAGQLWGRRAGLLATLAITLNPFAISFAPTAYTDPLLVLAGMLAFYMALRGQAFWAGLCLGIAIMTKQQGILYAPLVAGLLYDRLRVVGGGWRGAGNLTPHALRLTLSLISGLSLIILPILYWDSLRWAVAPSPWNLSVRNYGGLSLVPIDQWPDRFFQWAELAWYLTASWPVWIIFIFLLSWKLAHAKPQRSKEQGAGGRGQTNNPQAAIYNLQLHHLVTLSPCHLVTLWSISFFALHVVTSVEIWDRYLLPLAPGVGLLAGWLGWKGLAAFPRQWFGLSLIVWALCLAPPAWKAATGGLPIGGDHGAYTGLTEAISWLTAEFPHQVTLYHHALGWHYRFYFYDQVAAGDYELRWFPNAVYLADNAAKTPQRRKFLIQPRWSPVRDLALQLAVRTLQLRERYRFGEFTLYELVQPPQPRCAWCSCTVGQQRWNASAFEGDLCRALSSNIPAQ